MRSMELPAGITKGISAEARRRHLSMAVNLPGSTMEARTKHACMMAEHSFGHDCPY